MYHHTTDNLLIRPFVVFSPLQKAAGDAAPGSERTVYGPVASETEDFDGETAERAGIIKGLGTFTRLGGTVDWDHLWPATHDPQFLIGKGAHFNAPDGRPWLKTDLRRDNKYADGVLKLHADGMRVGHSIYGTGVKDGKTIKSTSITMVTIAPQPKGFDMFLQKEHPGDSLYAVAKGIVDDAHVAGLIDDWVEVPRNAIDFVNPSIENLQKALLTGAGVVMPGDTGGGALRSQYLVQGTRGSTRNAKGPSNPDDLPEFEALPETKTGRRKTRKPAAESGLSKALTALGAGNGDALASAITDAFLHNHNPLRVPRTGKEKLNVPNE